MSDHTPEATEKASDADLVLRARSGDTRAFGTLWERHYRSGIVAARSITSSFEADDLVQEAYARIFQALRRGKGPTGSFRAYLFTSIRNTAASWGRARRETAIDELDTVADPDSTEQATDEALDRSLTVRAFRSLPSRWQEVLWYTAIEQMKPAEVGPLLGMSAGAVSQLAFRAREGLREAWIGAHLQSVEDGSECQWAIESLGAYALGNLGNRTNARLERHLGECARCLIVAGEAKDVSSRLALVLLPLILGVSGATAYTALLQTGTAVAAVAMPATVTGGMLAGSAVAGGAEGSAGAAAGAGGAVAAGGGVLSGAALSITAGLAAVVIAGGIAAATILPGILGTPPADAADPDTSAIVDTLPSAPPIATDEEPDAEEQEPEETVLDEADDLPLPVPPEPDAAPAPPQKGGTVVVTPAPEAEETASAHEPPVDETEQLEEPEPPVDEGEQPGNETEQPGDETEEPIEEPEEPGIPSTALTWGQAEVTLVDRLEFDAEITVDGEAGAEVIVTFDSAFDSTRSATVTLDDEGLGTAHIRGWSVAHLLVPDRSTVTFAYTADSEDTLTRTATFRQVGLTL